MSSREQQFVGAFIGALARLEAERNVAPIASCFGEASRTTNVAAGEEHAGPTGAQTFWMRYRDTFDETRSTFRNIIIANARAALE